MSDLLHELVYASAASMPANVAVIDRDRATTYAELAALIDAAAAGLAELGVGPGDRIAVLMPKRLEKVVAIFAALKIGAIAVPVNALLKAPQVGHILRDSGAVALVTTTARISDLLGELGVLTGLRAIVTVDESASVSPAGLVVTAWAKLLASSTVPAINVMDRDRAVIFYTSGSTGKPKGVVVTHRNLVIGARSVASYLKSSADDRVLAVLSLSFDYGFNQLATSFLMGATVVLLDYRLPQEVLRTIERERVTGLAGVPPIWNQLVALDWPEAATSSLRYITNSGGAMPSATLARLRGVLPSCEIYLMYGLTEAFRSTYLFPEHVERRPDSIGKAIPNAEVLVLRANGETCEPGEAGELVHRGPLVAQGYWNDPQKTAQRFRIVPGQRLGTGELEMEVWSGDTVRMDEEGYLYFVGRRDEMIKTSGYRVSPTEIEEEAYGTGLVADAVAFGVPYERLGQGIILVVTCCAGGSEDTPRLMEALQRRLPRFMLPMRVEWRSSVPRTSHGKYDRVALREEMRDALQS